MTYCTLFPIQWCSRGRGWKAQCQQEEYKPPAPGHSESQTPTAWSGQYRYCKGDRKFQGECCADKQFKILPQGQNTGGKRHQAERTRAKSVFVFSFYVSPLLKILFNGKSYHPNLSGCIIMDGARAIRYHDLCLYPMCWNEVNKWNVSISLLLHPDADQIMKVAQSQWCLSYPRATKMEFHFSWTTIFSGTMALEPASSSTRLCLPTNTL